MLMHLVARAGLVQEKPVLREALGGFDQSVDGADDWELWIRLVGQGPREKCFP